MLTMEKQNKETIITERRKRVNGTEQIQIKVKRERKLQREGVERV
jgi:hypothetical protein